MIDKLGGLETYGHYPNGWAMAFNTPFKMWKRYSFNGGTCDPCVISWPAGIAARGEVRDQYHHAIDIVPTLLDCLGLELPATVKGAPQIPLQGVSMRYSFDSAALPSAKSTQFYSMLGTRGIWHQAGRPSPPTRRSAAGATSSGTPGSCTTPTPTAPNSTTSRARSPSGSRS